MQIDILFNGNWLTVLGGYVSALYACVMYPMAIPIMISHLNLLNVSLEAS